MRTALKRLKLICLGIILGGNENIREFNLTFNNQDNGFVGSAVIAILESHGAPTESIEMTSRSIEIEGDSYTLEKA